MLLRRSRCDPCSARETTLPRRTWSSPDGTARSAAIGLARAPRSSVRCGVPLARKLGPLDATMIVVSGIIGSGIFINPHLVARDVETPFLILMVWGLGGGIALAGAFVFAELGTVVPRAGGQYAFFRE